MGVIVSQIELKQIVTHLKQKKTKIAFTCGCFDLLHIGHIRTLKEAKSHGDVLIVGINSDDSIRQIKGELRPILPEEERAEIIASLNSIDYVTIFSESTPENLIDLVKPDFHIKAGYDLNELPEADLVNSYGGKVIVVKELDGYSTTTLIERILNLYC